VEYVVSHEVESDVSLWSSTGGYSQSESSILSVHIVFDFCGISRVRISCSVLECVAGGFGPRLTGMPNIYSSSFCGSQQKDTSEDTLCYCSKPWY